MKPSQLLGITAMVIVLFLMGFVSYSLMYRGEPSGEPAAQTEPLPGEALAQAHRHPIDRAVERAALVLDREQLDSPEFHYLVAKQWYQELGKLFSRDKERSHYLYDTDYNLVLHIRQQVLAGTADKNTTPAGSFAEYARLYRAQALLYRELQLEDGLNPVAFTQEEDFLQTLLEADYNNKAHPNLIDGEAVRSSWSQEQQFLLVAAIPEEDIYLYLAEPFGMILSAKGEEQLLPWPGLTPRGILPQMRLMDLDKDGVEELVVSLYVGSGTGVAIEELHVVEIQGGTPFTDYAFANEDAEKLLRHRLSGVYDNTGEQFILYLDGEAHTFPTPAEGDLPLSMTHLDLSNIVFFELEEHGVRLRIVAGLYHGGYGIPAQQAILTADVVYNGGWPAFQLENLALAPATT